MMMLDKPKPSVISVVFWTTAGAVDAYGLLLLFTLVNGEPMFVNWFLDATYSVWFYVAFGVIFVTSAVYLTACLTKKWGKERPLH